MARKIHSPHAIFVKGKPMKNILRNLKKFDLILLAALAILIAGFILSGYLYVTSYEKEFTASVAQKLSAISELKAGELV